MTALSVIFVCVPALRVSVLWCFVLLKVFLGFIVSNFCHAAVTREENKQWHLEAREERVSGDVLFRAVERRVCVCEWGERQHTQK